MQPASEVPEPKTEETPATPQKGEWAADTPAGPAYWNIIDGNLAQVVKFKGKWWVTIPCEGGDMRLYQGYNHKGDELWRYVPEGETDTEKYPMPRPRRKKAKQ